MTAPAAVKPTSFGPVAVGAVAVALSGVVAAVPPAGQAFYPQCPLYRLTGLLCPGCGATRAAHALLTGDVARALHDNVLLLVAVPVVLYLWVAWIGRRSGRFALPAVRPSPRAVAVVCSLVVAFGVLRNLPFAPFSALAP